MIATYDDATTTSGYEEYTTILVLGSKDYPSGSIITWSSTTDGIITGEVVDHTESGMIVRLREDRIFDVPEIISWILRLPPEIPSSLIMKNHFGKKIFPKAFFLHDRNPQLNRRLLFCKSGHLPKRIRKIRKDK